MSRSLKKGPYVDQRLLEKVAAARATKDRKPIKTWSRDCTISPEMVGLTFDVHNGKNFLPVFVDENMVGHKLGEFSSTRKFIKHGGKLSRETEAAAATATTSAKAASGEAAPAAPKK